jgi:hypothetical protein
MGAVVADPFSPADFGSLVLTEGIKFLYQQAGAVLKRWRERREGGTAPAERAALRPPDGLLDGTVAPAEPRDDQAAYLEQELRETRRLLADYAEGIEVPQQGDRLAAEQADALRRLLEAAYGQRITFRGEQRPPSGPMVIGEIDVKQVAGDAAAVRVKLMGAGEVRASAKAERVEEGGRLSAIEIDNIG